MDPIMDDNRPRLEGLIPPRRLGLLLLGLRQARGDSLDTVGVRTNGAVTPDRLLALETGECAPTEIELDALSGAYAFALTDLVPQRVDLVLDYDERLIDAGGGFAAIVPEGTTLEEVLQRYLILVWALRGRQPGSYLQLRDLDIAVLGDGLGVGAAAVVGMLSELLDDQEWVAPYRHPSQYGRPRFATVVPDAGIMLCGGHGGALVFRPDRSAPPEPMRSATDLHLAEGRSADTQTNEPGYRSWDLHSTDERQTEDRSPLHDARTDLTAHRDGRDDGAATSDGAQSDPTADTWYRLVASPETDWALEQSGIADSADAVPSAVSAQDFYEPDVEPVASTYQPLYPEPPTDQPVASTYQPLYAQAPESPAQESAFQPQFRDRSAETTGRRTLPTLGTSAADADPFADLRRAFTAADDPAPSAQAVPEPTPPSRGADLSSWFDRSATPAVIVEEEASPAAAFLSSLAPQASAIAPAAERSDQPFDDFGGLELRWGAALDEPRGNDPTSVAETPSGSPSFAHIFARDDQGTDPTPTVPTPLVPTGLPYAIPEQDAALPAAAPAPWDPQGSPRLLRKLFPGRA